MINALGQLQGLPNERSLEESDPKRAKLKEVCHEFEAVMVSIILKEGMGGAKELSASPEDETDSGSETFKNFAYEQLSYCVGKSGLLGLGDQIYESMKDRLAAEDSRNAAAAGKASSSKASSETPSDNALGRLLE
jgi:Rod binding domain-containing protein